MRTGQTVKLKFAACPFQKNDTGEGSVEHVSADAQSEEETRDAAMLGPEQCPVRYKSRASLATHALQMEGRAYPISVGTEATAEILLGDRTVAEYLRSPVQKAWHEAAWEP